ncbi:MULTISPECIES: inositol monophosphatase family protein [Pacificibacter]|uniref:inositol monophosphatase family protein n=1 Tax=Pacificibacter TaxID=1042323 RepID=UPI001C09B248|nr:MULTISPECIES: inositol monophosphatase family protein [Pacificibacter]MBU2937486.1 inositol monophosphatase family protein [Pacificibacter marinus]MDO6615666.1 inositol monophosphatase family protein [Pacificibacter sp. 1_MG-2023]
MTQLKIGTEQQASLIATAHAAADAAREVTLQYFRGTSLGTESKLAAGFDPVTVADRGAEEIMRKVISEMRPDDAIHGEEFGPKEGTSGLTWVLDPIDGTRGFISGTPTWGVLIACRDDASVHLGVIDQPYIGERFFGGFGLAEVTGPHGVRPLAARKDVSLSDAIIFTTFPEVGTAADRRGFENVANQCKLTRYGMDCYAYALLAAGQIDLVIEAGLQPYDILGPIGVIEAAGGVVTDWQGKSAQNGGRILAAGSQALLAEALELLKDV